MATKIYTDGFPIDYPANVVQGNTHYMSLQIGDGDPNDQNSFTPWDLSADEAAFKIVSGTSGTALVEYTQADNITLDDNGNIVVKIEPAESATVPAGKHNMALVLSRDNGDVYTVFTGVYCSIKKLF